LALGTNALGLGGIAHPQPDVVAVLGQQIRNGGTEATAAKHRYGLLFNHGVSVLSHPVAMIGIIT
jgi:hypothetical protein